MQRTIGLLSGILVAAGLLIGSLARLGAQPAGAARVALAADDIGGVVTSAAGPEAGVWVIAETTGLPTKFARIVVTDDRGRYVLPDLPRASYEVFVRGYGLVDSPRQPGKPGQELNLKAMVAPDARAAEQVYPAAWWASMITLPAGDDRLWEGADVSERRALGHLCGGPHRREASNVGYRRHGLNPGGDATLDSPISSGNIEFVGEHGGAPELIAAIHVYLASHNQHPTIFQLTASVEQILANVAKCKEALG